MCMLRHIHTSLIICVFSFILSVNLSVIQAMTHLFAGLSGIAPIALCMDGIMHQWQCNNTKITTISFFKLRFSTMPIVCNEMVAVVVAAWKKAIAAKNIFKKKAMGQQKRKVMLKHSKPSQRAKQKQRAKQQQRAKEDCNLSTATRRWVWKQKQNVKPMPKEDSNLKHPVWHQSMMSHLKKKPMSHLMNQKHQTKTIPKSLGTISFLTTSAWCILRLHSQIPALWSLMMEKIKRKIKTKKKEEEVNDADWWRKLRRNPLTRC